MPLFLSLVLVAGVALELAVLVAAVNAVGFGWVFLWILATVLAGGFVLRLTGIAAVLGLTRAAAEGRPPFADLTDAAALALGGVLLILPGLVGDAIGILLCLAPLRRLLLVFLAGQRPAPPPGPGTIDGEFTVVRDPAREGRDRTED